MKQSNDSIHKTARFYYNTNTQSNMNERGKNSQHNNNNNDKNKNDLIEINGNDKNDTML